MPEAWDAGFLPRDGALPALSGLAAGPAGGFAAGNELDVMLPGVPLAGFAEDVAGPGGRCAGASDDQLIGVLRAWDRLESWTAARQLAVIAELIRRRPAPGCSPEGPAAMPAGWGKFCGDELAAATASSKLAADKTLNLAHDLAVRLPRTARALHEGTITLYKARLVADATRDLTPEEAAAAEALILDGAAARINLTIPLATLLGLAERPAEASGLGVIDPALARTLAHAAAPNPRTTWCITVTDDHGHPTAHGCARPARGSPGRRNEPSEPSRPNGGGVPADGDRPSGRSRPSSGGVPSDRHGPIGRNRARARGVTAFIREGDNGPPRGYGRWRLRPAGGRELLVPIEPLAILDCDHRHESARYQPSDKLRHLVEIHDGECDFEHAIPYNQGGRTCACNAGPRCRRHHHAKQTPGWSVEQHLPGYQTWNTPAGRTYTTGPMQYPV